MPRSFLKAEWRHLVLLTYPTPDHLLAPHLPPGLELDRWQGQALCSIVAFRFIKTRVWGVPWPGLTSFPEINLRFYVRHGTERGVMFIRETVPSRLIASVARGFYNEPYVNVAMSAKVTEDAELISAEYGFNWEGVQFRIEASGQLLPITPGEETFEHFLKEQTWGYGRSREGKTTRYRVDHPRWRIHPVETYGTDIDWRWVFGPGWEAMQDVMPISTMLAEGSPVTVGWGEGVE